VPGGEARGHRADVEQADKDPDELRRDTEVAGDLRSQHRSRGAGQGGEHLNGERCRERDPRGIRRSLWHDVASIARSIRRHAWNNVPAVATVKAKIGVGREDDGIGECLSHTHKARVGEAHGHVCVLLHELQHGLQVIR